MSREQVIRSISGVTAVYCLIFAPWFAWALHAQEGLTGDSDTRQTVNARVVFWDTGRPYKQGAAPSAAIEDKSRWTRVPIGTNEDYRFNGDCVVENEYVWLYLPAYENSPAVLWGKSSTADARRLTLYTYDAQGQRRNGPKGIKVLRNVGHEAVVEYGTGTQRDATHKVAYRVVAGMHWIEAKPIENAGGLGIDVKSQLVVVPSEFGEDFICDSLKQKSGAKVSIPRDNLVIGLDCDGNSVSVITYPSVDQAGDILIGSDKAVSNHGHPVFPSISAVNANFKGQSIFVGLLDDRDNWHFERIRRIYSSSGQYISDWKPPYQGRWRLTGRVRGRHRINDVTGDHFAFACSWSGTFEYLFMYLYARTEDTPADIVTPMDIYRETLGAGPSAYLLESDIRGGVQKSTKRTKHRDVCGTVNDLKDTWKDHLDRVKKDPNYISDLAEDAKAIMERLENRCNEYRTFVEALGEVCAAMEAKQGTAEYRQFASSIRKHHAELDKMKPTRYAYGCQVADEIERICREQPERLTTDRQRLDELAERVRAVAQFQEDSLKPYRRITAAISDLCLERRESGRDELKHYVTVIGRLCRQLLRNRDPEE
ncbi:MAG: hypothetical protein H8E44_13295 [Planctomycetes bacterium]|nr:hypothetical protein [Planctomycetota bacterium]MBL7044086.1 hypothetical protein [Pirellulaceae bacterium]